VRSKEAAMTDEKKVTLTMDETQLLEMLLMGDQTRLISEIAHTDHREYRELLKSREELLKRVLMKLAA
jgi:hypothetical protein